MNVCLVNSPFYTEEVTRIANPLVTNSSFSTSRLFVGYVSSYIASKGISNDIIDFNLQGIRYADLYKKINAWQYDVICVYLDFQNEWLSLTCLARIARANKDSFIIAMGYYPTLGYHDLLRKRIADCCILGEAEITIYEVVTAIFEKLSWKDVHGIAFFDGTEVRKTQARHLIDDINSLPYPIGNIEKKVSSVFASRGCNGKCTFCAKIHFYRTCTGSMYRRRSPQSVFEEITFLFNQHGVTHIVFSDIDFIGNDLNSIAWIDDFLNLLEQSSLDICFECTMRVSSIINTQNQLERFVALGLIRVEVGVESFIERQLKLFCKQVNVEQNIDALRILEKIDVGYYVDLIFFDPDVTVDELIEYIEAVRKISLFTKPKGTVRPLSSYSTVLPYENTPIDTYIKKKKLTSNEFPFYRFMDAGAERCYAMVKKWSKISGVHEIFEDKWFTHQFYFPDCMKEYHSLYLELFRIDYNAIYDICIAIKKGNGDDFMIMENISGIYTKPINDIKLKIYSKVKN